MRGNDVNQSAMFSYRTAEERVPKDHPLRAIRKMCDLALRDLSRRFAKLYSRLGRRSVPPEQLMRALLLQALYSVRSERLLMEQLGYDLLFKWFVGLDMDEEVWDASVFSKNRERLLKGDIAQAFFEAVLKQAREKDLMSDEHFTVDGTLLEAWASKKSFRQKEEAPTEGSGARGKVLLRDTHECLTDPDARMYRKSTGGAFQICHMAHTLMENRNGFPVGGKVTAASNDAEWEAGLELLGPVTNYGKKKVTAGMDSAYDYEAFTVPARELKVTPHVVQHTNRSSSIDERTTRHPGYKISLQKRKLVEQIFGWIKNVAMLRKVHHRGQALVQWNFKLALAAYSLVRMRTLTLPAAAA